MDIFGQYKSPLGYFINNNQIDSYGVNHAGFSTADELQYQSARTQRENQLMEQMKNQGITEYPQFGADFWGTNSDNNYGFGSSNISPAVENMQMTGGNSSISNDTDLQTNNDLQSYRSQLFNGQDCGGMRPEFADKIASAESKSGCINNENDYKCVNKNATAYGRYQMQKNALIDAGVLDKSSFPINSRDLRELDSVQNFLNSPQTQEQALCNFLVKADKYNQNWNNYKFLGKNVQVGALNIPLTKEILLAGTHREGAKNLNNWLNDVAVENGKLVRAPYFDTLDHRKRNITERFQKLLDMSK